MAGTNIEIKIAATGGAAAASEIQKVETSANSLAGSTGNKGLKALQDESGKVTSANVRMGTGMQNVGYQVQDLAVQIGSGTSAFRALGQQMPQLLSGFGPVGIALGTISAVAVPLAGALLNMGESAEETGARAVASAKHLDELEKSMAAVIKTNMDKSWADFVKALDDGDAAVTRANTALTRRKELLDAITAAQDKVDKAKTAEETAAVDADPNLTPAEKIRKKAEIQDRAAKDDAGKEINKVTGAADEAAAVAERKKEAARITQEKLEAVQEEKAKEDAERKRLEKSEKLKEAAAKQIPAREKQVATLQTQTDIVTYNPLRDQESKMAAQDKLAADQAALEDLRNRATRNPGDAAKLKALKDREAESKAELARREEANQKARDEANDAGLDAENKRKIADAVVPEIQTATAAQSRTRATTAGAAISAAQQQARDKAEAQALQADRKTAASDRKEDSAAARYGREAERMLPKDVPEKFRKAVESVSDNLQNGDQGGEMTKMLELMEQLATHLGKTGDKSGLARRIDQLEQRIKGIQ